MKKIDPDGIIRSNMEEMSDEMLSFFISEEVQAIISMAMDDVIAGLDDSISAAEYLGTMASVIIECRSPEFVQAREEAGKKMREFLVGRI